MQIVDLAAADTYPLRRSVLREGTWSDQVVFDGDDLATTFHLGVRDGEALIAISTWMERRYPDLPELAGYQLRGMATDATRRSGGLGSALLGAGVERCRAFGAEVVWARARVSALGFYERSGFEARGAEYTDLATGRLHVDIIQLLA